MHKHTDGSKAVNDARDGGQRPTVALERVVRALSEVRRKHPAPHARQTRSADTAVVMRAYGALMVMPLNSSSPARW